MRCAFLLLGLLTLLSACLDGGDECVTGPARCEDGRAITCPGGCWLGTCNTSWQTVECEDDQVCIETDERALCVLDARPDPHCRSRYVYCADDGRVVFCDEGYATHADDCPASGRTCSESPAQCIEPDAPHDICPLDGAAFCRGDLKHECYGGYVTRTTDCEAGCIKPEGFSHASCIHPDSAELCAPENLPTPEYAFFCHGEDQLLHCHEGLALEFENCAQNGRVCSEGLQEYSDDWCVKPSDAAPR